MSDNLLCRIEPYKEFVISCLCWNCKKAKYFEFVFDEK